MKKSCGFLIQCHNKFLLCHATKPSGKINLDDGQWGIPKGGIEEGESEVEAALRETREETSLILDHYLYSASPLHTYHTKNKEYVVFHCKINDPAVMNQDLICSTMIGDTKNPENDAFIWVDWDKAKEIAIKNQKFNLFIDEVKAKIK
jgi:8-oxo-dGTP pyrophosphatase MutT (NUDIX family)